jgi:hypothetical protein
MQKPGLLLVLSTAMAAARLSTLGTGTSSGAGHANVGLIRSCNTSVASVESADTDDMSTRAEDVLIAAWT